MQHRARLSSGPRKARESGARNQAKERPAGTGKGKAPARWKGKQRGPRNARGKPGGIRGGEMNAPGNQGRESPGKGRRKGAAFFLSPFPRKKTRAKNRLPRDRAAGRSNPGRNRGKKDAGRNRAGIPARKKTRARGPGKRRGPPGFQRAPGTGPAPGKKTRAPGRPAPESGPGTRKRPSAGWKRPFWAKKHPDPEISCVIGLPPTPPLKINADLTSLKNRLSMGVA